MEAKRSALSYSFTRCSSLLFAYSVPKIRTSIERVNIYGAFLALSHFSAMIYMAEGFAVAQHCESLICQRGLYFCVQRGSFGSVFLKKIPRLCLVFFGDLLDLIETPVPSRNELSMSCRHYFALLTSLILNQRVWPQRSPRIRFLWDETSKLQWLETELRWNRQWQWTIRWRRGPRGSYHLWFIIWIHPS